MSTHDKHLEIAVANGQIAGTLITPGTLAPGVLFVHGWGGSQEQYLMRARHIAALGCICLTFDLSGHAGTRPLYETVTRETNLHDVLAAYDLLVSQPHVDPNAIAVVGSSYGGYLASILTSMRQVRWLSLRSPALYIDTGWETPKLQLHVDQDLKTYRHSIVAPDKNRALQACSHFDGDVMLIESEFDTTVPHAVVASYREAFKLVHSLTYRCVDGADHGMTRETDQRAYSSLLYNWLTEMLSGARANNVVPRHRPADATARPETPPQPH